MLTFTDMPHEILLTILSFLPVTNLFQSERVCSLWHDILNSNISIESCWKMNAKAITNQAIVITTPQLDVNVHQWKKICKFLHDRVGQIYAPANLSIDEKQESEESSTDESSPNFDRSLLFSAIEGSSVDQESQSIKETLPANYRLHRTFWSSTGSDTEDADEWIVYQLKSASFVQCLELAEKQNQKKPERSNTGDELDIMLIESMKVKPFMAVWQQRNVYAPKKVSVSIGRSKDDCQLFVTKEFNVKNNPAFQHFNIGPILVISKHEGLFKDQMNEVSTVTNDDTSDDANHTMDDEEEAEGVALEDQDDIAVDEEMDQTEQEGQTNEYEQLLQRCTHEEALEALYLTNHVINLAFFEHLRRTILRREETQKHMDERRKKVELATQMLGSVTEAGDVFLRLNLQGKYQTQPEDDKYYTCLEAVDVSGTATIL